MGNVMLRQNFLRNEKTIFRQFYATFAQFLDLLPVILFRELKDKMKPYKGHRFRGKIRGS